MFREVVQQFPFTSPLIESLREIYVSSTKDRKKIKSFVLDFYEYLRLSPSPELVYETVFSTLKSGVPLVTVDSEIKKWLRLMKKEMENEGDEGEE